MGTIIVNGGNVKEMLRIRRTILLLFTLIVIWNNVACNEIESFNEKSNATEEDCLDGACREIIDVNYTIDNTNLEISSSEDSPIFGNVDETIHVSCPENLSCEELPAECLTCQYNFSCIYGQMLNITCKAKTTIKCTGSKNFEKSMTCQYCYQTSSEEHSCSKNVHCNWTSGYRWSTTLFLSITLGGFGADRFYLGHWQEGIGKLFSFGGAGVWTLIDVILIAVGYLKPADG